MAPPSRDGPRLTLMPVDSLVSPQAQQRQIGFVLLPGFSLLSQACALEPLQVANQLAGQTLYQAVTFALDGRGVASAAGLSLSPDSLVASDSRHLDALFVCGAQPAGEAGLQEVASNPALLAWLKRLAERGVMLGGISTGTRELARAGLLDGYRATIHWQRAESFRRDFPQVNVSHQLYELDRDRVTCGGGTAAMDMMMTLIAQQHGRALAEKVSEHFVCERIRLADEPQHVPLKNRFAHAPQPLVEAVTLMEANIEEPLSTHEIGEHLGISRRQLERLFKKHLQAVPSRYYLDLRLARSRQLLRESDQPIGEIALATGFSSAAHFSTAFRNHFGRSPRDERLMLQA